MTQRDSWSTAQQPFFVPGPSGYVPTDPAEKANQAAALAAQVAAFRKAGGKVEVIAGPSHGAQKRNTSRNAKA
ncbi:hypothetical protein [Stenotrophomonas rhizophila]|uniref:hypothetical protein n=1 Tax=Stenotrophomonas rhizophila TaxID=216778 RepID=UPI001E287008|nr:hypothetical protein [Stenotrophomonas rhizophila]MCC7632560.1 hypothetical protein [Stenotrophomonas rhizophila]MCC7663412.1 hypothetical protein [Stenotrophomonas rhizophila]